MTEIQLDLNFKTAYEIEEDNRKKNKKDDDEKQKDTEPKPE
jgi:hypothetical protein